MFHAFSPLVKKCDNIPATTSPHIHGLALPEGYEQSGRCHHKKITLIRPKPERCDLRSIADEFMHLTWMHLTAHKSIFFQHPVNTDMGWVKHNYVAWKRV